MTPAEFRRLALSLQDSAEASHMGHPDFRVSGRIFATLGYPRAGFATLMLSPEDQDFVVKARPEVFAPAAGAWGRRGCTTVVLAAADRTTVRAALRAAWERQVVAGAAKRTRPRRRPPRPH